MKTFKSDWAQAISAIVLALALSAWASFPAAALTVAPIFKSEMVLQRGVPVPLFGTANPGAIVDVQFQDQSVSTTAGGDGKWRVNLASMAASPSAAQLLVSSSDGASISFAGVQVGEVWLCGGQSNMGFTLQNANGGAAAVAESSSFNIRLFRMTGGNGPSTTAWQVASAASAAGFSAVCWWMGRELAQSFGNVPIGLIQATHDGTAIEQWTHANGGTGEDYDAMVKAIQPFALKGVAWYQGESNGGDIAYATKLGGMIQEWRSDWGQPSLPFGIVQLHARSGWNAARNAQLVVSQTLNDCFLVVIKDLPGGSLHPPEKKPVGIRAAIGARGKVYGQTIVYSGPVRDVPNSYVSGKTVVLAWQHPGDGLFTSDGQAPGPFKIAGASGQFQNAQAAISGNTVTLTSSVAVPAKVQFAYSGTGNLFNRVYVPTEGGASSVDRLKASEFEIALASGGCTASRVRVAAIVPGTWSAGAGNKGGSAQVTILDDCGNAVAGATVQGTFSGGFSETGSEATGANGVATIYTSGSKKGALTFTFCVGSVAAGLVYDPGANAETCDGL